MRLRSELFETCPHRAVVAVVERREEGLHELLALRVDSSFRAPPRSAHLEADALAIGAHAEIHARLGGRRRKARLAHAAQETAARLAQAKLGGNRDRQGDRLSAQRAKQLAYGATAELEEVVARRREGRKRRLSFLDVVETHDADGIRNRDPSCAQRAERAQRRVVVARGERVERDAPVVEEDAHGVLAVRSHEPSRRAHETRIEVDLALRERVAVRAEPILGFAVPLGPADEGHATPAMLLDEVAHGIEHAPVVVAADARHAVERERDAHDRRGGACLAERLELLGSVVLHERAAPHDDRLDAAGFDHAPHAERLGIPAVDRTQIARAHADEVRVAFVRTRLEPGPELILIGARDFLRDPSERGAGVEQHRRRRQIGLAVLLF
jgi:hypothetical protein